MKKNLYIVLLLLSIVLWRQDCSIAETRAMWITRFQMDSPEKIDRFIGEARKNGVNMLFVQVLGRGIAYYRSDLIPYYDLGFDPLAYAIDRAHRSGIKLHAWLNTYYVWTNPELPEPRSHVVNSKPEWLMSKGNIHYLNPSIPEVKDYLYDIYMEVARKYDVDGIHYDYVRYPDEFSGLDRRTRELYRTSYGIDPVLLVTDKKGIVKKYGWKGYMKFREKLAAYKSRQVTELVRRIADGVRSLDKDIEISAAVFADISVAKREKGQDWFTWLREGSIDFAAPMIYSEKMQSVKTLMLKSAKVFKKKKVIVGLGAYKVSSNQLVDQIQMYRRIAKDNNSLGGFCLFSYDSIAKEPLYLEKVRKNAF